MRIYRRAASLRLALGRKGACCGGCSCVVTTGGWPGPVLVCDPPQPPPAPPPPPRVLKDSGAGSATNIEKTVWRQRRQIYFSYHVFILKILKIL